MTASPRRPALVSLLVTLIAAAAILAAAGPAAAQGTSGTLPDPISSRDIAMYADHLGLDDDQRRAIDPFHEQYRDGFRELREAEIAAYLEGVSGLWSRGMRGLDPDAIKDSIDQLERVVARIRLLDDGLFNQIQSVLREDQAEALPRVMQARQRHRYQTGATRMVGYMNRAARVDLSRLYADLDLSDEERQLADPFVLQYEGRLTAATKALWRASTRIFLDVAEAMAEVIARMEDADDQARRAMRQTMSTAWNEASRKPREKAARISDLNLRTLGQLAELLSQENAATLRARYLLRGYPEVPTGAGAAERSFRVARKLENTSATTKSDVEAAADQFHAGRDAIIDDMVSYIDQYRREGTPWGMRRESRREHDEKLDKFKQRLADLDDRTLEALHAMLGAQIAGTLKTAVAQADLNDEQVAGIGRGAAGPGPDAAGEGPGVDPFLPPPIGARDIAFYRKRLGLDDNDRFILESLYEEYWDAYRRTVGADIAALDAAKARLPAPDPRQDGGEVATVEQVDEIYGLRSRAFKSIQSLDRSFFDDMETLVSSEQQLGTARSLRLARERAVYNRRLDSGMETMFSSRFRRRGPDLERQSQESDVDLVSVVEGLDLPAEQRREIDAVLSTYETEAVEGFASQYDRVTRLRAESERIRARHALRSGDDDRDNRRSRFEDYRKLMEEQGREAGDTRKIMIDLNRATLAALTEALDDDLADALVLAYNREAHPSVYNDPGSADPFLSAALALPDLDSSQRSAVEAILQEYTPANRALSDRIAEIYAASEAAPGTGFDRGRWRADQENRNRIEAIQFDRDEVNAKAFRQLRGLLTERQKTRLQLPSEVVGQDDDEQTS